MEQTSLEELKRTAASGAYRRIPIWREIFSDIATPVQVLKKLLAVSDHCFLLESAEDNKQWGRYSFLGFDPAMELTCMNHQVTITTDHVEQFETENPAQVIARVIEENRAPQIKKLPPLTGGLAEQNKKDEGKEFTILIENFSKRSREQMMGRTEQNNEIPHPFPLNTHFGALAAGLGSFPFDYPTYLG